MRITVLASGSGGNATVVEADGTLVLFDCGISVRQLERRMAAAGQDPTRLDAVFLSHEHIDHVRGMPVLGRRRRLPLFATTGTLAAVPEPLGVADALTAGREVRVGSLTVLPVATSHDAAEPVAFLVAARGCRVAVVTDTGMVPDGLAEALEGCSAVLLEANHDPDMLRTGSYPWSLKQRISSVTGHLSNEQSARAVERLAHGGLEVVVGMHLSRENNTPGMALRELERPLRGSAVHVAVADQDRPLVIEIGQPSRQNGQRGLFEA